MKTKEFMAKVEALGYEVGSFKTDMNISDSDGHELAIVSKKHRFAMDTDMFEFVTYVNDDDAEKIATLLFEYSSTPQSEREEEKRHYLRLVTPPIIKKQVPKYLRYTEYLECFTVGLARDTGDAKIKTIFTESEIAEMDITGFVKEDVEG